MKTTLLVVFLLVTGLFCSAQNYETVNYGLNGTPNNGIKIKTNLPYTNSSQMVNVKIEGYSYGNSAAIGLNIVWYIYGDVFFNHSVSSWGAYTPDIFLSNEDGLVCITLADKPYFPRLKVSAFVKGTTEQAAWFNGWTVVDQVAAGTNITAVPYKNAVRNLTLSTNLPNSAGTYNLLTSNATTGAVEKITPNLLNQTLSLGTTAGNLILSGGNNVNLTSVALSASNIFPDANVIGNGGLYPFVNSTGSSNYPSATGGGLRFTRVNNTALGLFEFNKVPDLSDDLFFRVGTGASSFSSWQKMASKEWSDTQYLPLKGGTLTGALNGTSISLSSNITANNVIINNLPGTTRGMAIYSAGSARWHINTNATAESGSNAGSDFALTRFGDNGVAIDNALLINRSTRNAVFGGTVTSPTFIGALTGNASSATNVSWTGITNKPTTLAGYGITNTRRYYNDYGPGIDANRFENTSLGAYQWLNAPVNGIGLLETDNTYQNNWTLQEFTSLAAMPRKFIRNYYSGTTWSPWYEFWHSGNFNNLSQLTTRNFTDLQNKPTSLSGYGITDAATQASVTALDANVVHKTGTENITGTKLFSSSVGIATTNTLNYKLAVGGGIIAESIKVKPQSGWADYVFEKDYPILPLKDLEHFILKNKHLPGIPTAGEVKKEGIDLGEINTKLLQKIEELTLYMIEKDKEVKKLTEMVEKLNNEFNSFKNK